MKTCLRCWAEVDLDALRHNLAWIRHRVGPRVQIMTVVKADAYGHGLKQIAALLMQSGTDIFGVANLAEARTIRSVGQGWPILMLGACLPDEVEAAVREDVRPTLSTQVEAAAFSAAAVRQHKTVPVHVKIDTGMGRLGAAPAAALDLLQAIQRLPGLALEGVYTHYAAAEDDTNFSRQQAQVFQKLIGRAKRDGLRIPLVHANNSAGLLHEPRTNYNLVRPGLLVYGVRPQSRRATPGASHAPFHPALSFKCRVTLVKDIQRGTSLSYGRAFTARRPMRVATLSAGYGDGYLRAGSSRARVLVGGQPCHVLGRITMDQMMVDVSRVPSAAPGDEAVLIGQQGNATITAADLAGWCRTVPWEVLTAITYRVPRLYRGGHAA
jgi:alanine racemase